jgi:hypothetical protein
MYIWQGGVGVDVNADGSIVEGEDRFVGADESHSTHIGSKVVDELTSFASLDGNVELTEIFVDEDIAELVIFHEFVAFPVNDRYMVSSFFETLGNVRSDESCSSSNAHLGPVSWG